MAYKPQTSSGAMASLKVKIEGMVTPEEIKEFIQRAMVESADQLGIPAYWRNATIYINACDADRTRIEAETIEITYKSGSAGAEVAPSFYSEPAVKELFNLRDVVMAYAAGIPDFNERMVFAAKDLAMQSIVAMVSADSAAFIERSNEIIGKWWDENEIIKKSSSKVITPSAPYPRPTIGMHPTKRSEFYLNWLGTQCHLEVDWHFFQNYLIHDHILEFKSIETRDPLEFVAFLARLALRCLRVKSRITHESKLIAMLGSLKERWIAEFIQPSTFDGLQDDVSRIVETLSIRRKRKQEFEIARYKYMAAIKDVFIRHGHSFPNIDELRHVDKDFFV